MARIARVEVSGAIYHVPDCGDRREAIFCEETDLMALRKGGARKAAIAPLIRRRTAVPNARIAQALHLGHVSRVSHDVRAAQTNRWAGQLEGLAWNERNSKADPDGERWAGCRMFSR